MSQQPVIDKDQLFLLYTLFNGDASKTSAASGGVSTLTIATLAKAEKWDDKVGEIAKLRTSDRPGDLERAINRAINYTDAHRYRRHLQRVINKIVAWPEEKLDEMLISVTVDKQGNVHRHLSTRALADLSSALEKAHALTYLALGDTAQDRARRKEESEAGIISASMMHQQVLKAMQEISETQTAQSQLLEARNRLAEEIANDPSTGEPISSSNVASGPAEFKVPPLDPKPKQEDDTNESPV